MIRLLDIKDVNTAEQVVQLQKAAYNIEAQLIHFYDIPPLMEKVSELQACGEIFYGYFLNNTLEGIISYKVIEGTLDIHRVAVHPEYFKRGIAGSLLQFVEEHNSGIKRFIVCTGKENLPAVNLYLKNNYHLVKDIEIAKKVYLTELEKLR